MDDWPLSQKPYVRRWCVPVLCGFLSPSWIMFLVLEFSRSCTGWNFNTPFGESWDVDRVTVIDRAERGMCGLRVMFGEVVCEVSIARVPVDLEVFVLDPIA